MNRNIRDLTSLGFVSIAAVLLIHAWIKHMSFESFRVLGFGWLTCVTTGLGAVPFVFVRGDSISEVTCAVANAVASGMMLAASVGMLNEASSLSGPFFWQVFIGLAVGVVFIKAARLTMGDGEEASIESLHGAVLEKQHFQKAALIFLVMFCHSAAEGVAVGVAFDSELEIHFGLYISILLAIHNIPEGMAMALVLVPRGVSIRMAAVIAILTSIPQPLMALASFYCVDAFHFLLPFGLAFAAGAMIYVSLGELIMEATEHLAKSSLVAITGSSFLAMGIIQVGLHSVTDL